MVLLRAPGIDNQQAPPWFEHTGNFRQSLTLEVVRQLVHHKGTQHDIERLVGKGLLLDQTNLEVDRKAAPIRFAAAPAAQLPLPCKFHHRVHPSYAPTIYPPHP